MAVTFIDEPGWYFITIFPKDVLTAQAMEMARFVLIMGILSLLIEVTILFFVLRNQVADPLKEFVHATNDIAGGDFDVQMDLDRNDELGQLAQSFTVMRDSIKEKISGMEQLTKIMESTSDLISMATPDGQLFYMNSAGIKMAGWPDDVDISTRQIGDVHPEWALQIIESQGIPTAIEKGLWEGETAVVDADGNEISVSQIIMSHKSVDGELDRISTIMRDITVSKRAEEEIRASEQQLRATNQQLRANEEERGKLVKTLEFKNKELRDIVYTTSHDLRSPLVNIQGFGGELNADCDRLLEMLSARTDDKDNMENITAILQESIPESLGFISESAKKMTDLLDGLLQISRVGSVEISSETLDMNCLTKEVLAAMEHQIQASGALVTVESLPGCIGDLHMLNNVLTNLVGNAVKYLDPEKDGQIKISGEAKNGTTVYCVADNGIGIDIGHQDKVFEIFHRLDPKDSVDGEGLGLTIVTRILDRLEGTVWVESVLGKGSKFFFSLPSVKA
jgi:PAS domain S-box-containing protein